MDPIILAVTKATLELVPNSQNFLTTITVPPGEFGDSISCNDQRIRVCRRLGQQWDTHVTVIAPQPDNQKL
ncbi:hypothetical protein TNCV_4663021 [Trichonephila clavipes]|uniref:Uncharacterized protein n=1 Tax=Trichonephila clavipes TaxID=2585209 RepID=A0A8X6SIM5_TRICX|nr:hypothetical protein TNCV_4663021 [Trichonephila clavipes]